MVGGKHGTITVICGHTFEPCFVYEKQKKRHSRNVAEIQMPETDLRNGEAYHPHKTQAFIMSKTDAVLSKALDWGTQVYPPPPF